MQGASKGDTRPSAIVLPLLPTLVVGRSSCPRARVTVLAVVVVDEFEGCPPIAGTGAISERNFASWLWRSPPQGPAHLGGAAKRAAPLPITPDGSAPHSTKDTPPEPRSQHPCVPSPINPRCGPLTASETGHTVTDTTSFTVVREGCAHPITWCWSRMVRIDTSSLPWSDT